MSEIWITSDLHINHNKDFVYGDRGFNSTEEMNEAIVERWNTCVRANDIIWNLGDFILGDINAAIPYIKRLNGTIYWIFGNHDTDTRIKELPLSCPNIRKHGYAERIKVHKVSFYLSHYPTFTSNTDDSHLWHRVINLHGHTHQKTNFLYSDNPFMYHVGVDSHNCYPVNIEEVIADIKNRYFELGTKE